MKRNVNLFHSVKPDPLHFPPPSKKATTPQTFQIKADPAVLRAVRPPCVTALRCALDGGDWKEEEEKGREGKRAGNHAAAVRVFGLLSAAGERRHGAGRAAHLAGRPGERSAQSERHVPRGGGADGGHPAHTGGGCGSGLRHVLSVPLSLFDLL